MKAVFFAMVLSLVSFTASAQEPGLTGRWATSQSMGGMGFEIRLDFTGKPFVKFSQTCSQQGHQLTVEASVPYIDTGVSLQLLGSATGYKEHSESGVSMSCSIELRPMTLEYRREGSRLRMISPVPGEADMIFNPAL